MFKKFRRKQHKRSILLDDKSDEITSRYVPLDKHSTILSCANKIADLVSNMNIYLLENTEKGDIRVKNNISRVVDIIPNSFMTRKSFIYKVVNDLILYGNSVCSVKIKKGEVQEIIPFQSDKVNFKEYGDRYDVIYNNINYKSDEVLHFALNIASDSMCKGTGFSNIVKESVLNLLQAESTKKAFLKDKWKPSLIITVSSDSVDLQDSETRERILGSYIDKSKAGEPWLLPADEIKVEKIVPLSLKDLAVQESITLDKKSICRDMGIPSFMLGVGEFNADEYNNFVATTISSISTVIQQELTRKLILNEKQYFKFNQKSLYNYNLRDKSDFIVQMVQNGIISRNEARNEFDYNFMENDGMDDILLLENYIPVNKAKDQEKLKGGEET